MNTEHRQPKGRDGVLSSLNVAIEALNLAKEMSGIAPANAAFGSVSALLAMIKDSMINQQDYVELGLSCADICRALDRGMNRKKLDELSQSVYEAIAQLTTTVAEIQRKVIKQSKRKGVSRLVHSKNDKEKIAAWKSDLNRILQVFSAELVMNTHVTVSDIRHDVSKIREGIDGRVRSAQTSIPSGESPPPPPRVCFGRDELIEKITGLAENLSPVALIGPGGIGKTSIALTVLHHDHIKKRFGDERRFIRCDRFPASLTHFLSQLSKTIGAGVENPEDLTPLRPFLSSKEMILLLDNAESILDPRGTNARETYAAVEELSRFNNICLCVTSRISTIPPACESLEIPTLSIQAARDAFYWIYKNGEHPDPVNVILEQLDFHPLSITLLATVALHNKWDTNRLTKEWGRERTEVLHTQHDESLAAAIELSLVSPMFLKLGPDARALLGVIAFFPQGVDENNLDWLFPTIPSGANIFDGFCTLSLTHRSNGFVTMLAPLRDYFCPRDPTSSPLLCATKDNYLRRLSVRLDPDCFEKGRWIISEDANVEHLLDTFTSIDATSVDVWDACAHFMWHLYWHKRRLVTLGPKIEGLPDDHPSKPECLRRLSWLYDTVGNTVRSKRLLVHILKIWRERGDDIQVAEALRLISDANRRLGLRKEAIQQGKEALEIYIRLNNTMGQSRAWKWLAQSYCDDGQLGPAEIAVWRSINLQLNEGDPYTVTECYRLLGDICHSRGETRKAIAHFETALAIAIPFNWRDELFVDSHAHIERAKSYAADDPYLLGRALELQAGYWRDECKFEEAKSEALRAAEVYGKIGAMKDVEDCRAILQDIEETMKTQVPLTGYRTSSRR